MGVRSSVEVLAGCLTKANLHVEVYRAVAAHASRGLRGKRAALAVAALSPATYSLFPAPGGGGGPSGGLAQAENAAELEARRLSLLELLLRVDFGLGFRVIHEFGLPPVRVYSSAAAQMASGREHGPLADLLHEVAAVVSDDEFDAVLAAGVAGYTASGAAASSEWSNYFVGGLGNPAQRLVEMMRGGRARVSGYLSIGLLDEAAQDAFDREDLGDVAVVRSAAMQAGDRRLADECTKFLDYVSGRRSMVT